MKTTFIEELRELKNNVGNRNGMLMRICIKGLGEGLSPQDVADAFAETDTGDPPLAKTEIERAISNAKSYTVGEAGLNEKRFAVKMKQIRKMREGTSPDERGFVRRMIEIGRAAVRRGSEDWSARYRLKCGRADYTPAAPLFDLRPAVIAGGKHEARLKRYAATFLMTLFPDDDGYVFATEDIHARRTKERMLRPSELKRIITTDRSNGRHIPTNIGTNLYTGEPSKVGDHLSYANKKTVKRRSHMLIEFDLMSPMDQAMFWYGVLVTKSLDVKTITSSGNESLHGVIEVPEMTAGYDLFGGVSAEASEQQWERNVVKVHRLCCSDEDVTYRADAACKDTTRMTRCAGGMRRINGVPTVNQALVWWNEKDFNSCKWRDNG